MLESYKQQILAVANSLHSQQLLAACDGNISVKLNDDEILITGAGKPKYQLSPDDFSVLTLDGEIRWGQPSSERLLHLAVYQHCPAARSVVHAHPPTAVAYTVAHPTATELPANCLSELIIAAGRIPIAPYALPGTSTMVASVTPFLSKHRIIILARHGALTWGGSLTEAAYAMERLEHSALILLRAYQFGGLSYLSEEDVAILTELRAQIGDRVI